MIAPGTTGGSSSQNAATEGVEQSLEPDSVLVRQRARRLSGEVIEDRHAGHPRLARDPVLAHQSA